MKRTLVGLVLVGLLVIPAAASAQSADNRRADVGVGYTFMHETGLSLPAGFVVSGAMRTSPTFDAVAEIGLNHGSVLGVGVNAMSFSGGLRANVPLQSGSMTPYAQVLTGLMHFSTSVLGVSASVNGWNIQPGFGVDVALNDQWSMRPQFDVMIERAQSAWGHDIRFGVSAVYKIK